MGKRLIQVSSQLPEKLIEELDSESKKVGVSRQRLMAAIIATALKDPKFTINWELLD